MSMEYADVRTLVSHVATLHGVSDGVAAMTVMTWSAMAMAREVPKSLRVCLAAACSRWFADVLQDGSLQEHRVECWKFLEAKHGNSTTVADREDIAVRTLICILWDEADEGDDLELGLEYFSQIANRFGGLEVVLGLCS